MLRVFATRAGLVVESGGTFRLLGAGVGFDTVFSAGDPLGLLKRAAADARDVPLPQDTDLLAPIGSQEVWAAGVTYMRSKTARMEESKDAGGGDFYDRVYAAERPELFFKATPHRVVGPGGNVRIRGDSKWNVPEPELTLAINSAGKIFGFSIGNDMSSRDIEGENPLYLPQAKVYTGSAALGPCLVIAEELPAKSTEVKMEIVRRGKTEFSGVTNIGQIKRPLPSLVEYLFRDNTFPQGAYLMTGTGIVPPDSFTLDHGDVIGITIDPAGTLRTVVA